MTLSYTTRFHLAIPDFLSEPWHADFATAMQSIDNALYSSIVINNSDVWLNSHVYAIGTLVIDSETGALWSCAVAHTSDPAPTTFAQDRAAHAAPPRWSPFVIVPATQAEAEAGVENSKYMTALRVAQAIDAQVVLPTFTFIGFSAHKNGTAQSGIAPIINTKLTFTTEVYDVGNVYDAANSKWTPPAGLIHIDAGMFFTSGLTIGSNASISVFKNGAQYKQQSRPMSAADGGLGISVDDQANGTDFYEIFVQGSSASTLIVSGSVAITWFMGHVTH